MTPEVIREPQPDKRVFAVSRILAGVTNVLVVAHDENGDWQFLDNQLAEPGDVVTTPLEVLLSHDPSLREILGISRGSIATRIQVGDTWRLSTGVPPLRLHLVDYKSKSLKAAGNAGALVRVKRRDWWLAGAMAGMSAGFVAIVSQVMIMVEVHMQDDPLHRNLAEPVNDSVERLRSGLVELALLALIGAVVGRFAGLYFDKREQIRPL